MLLLKKERDFGGRYRFFFFWIIKLGMANPTYLGPTQTKTKKEFEKQIKKREKKLKHWNKERKCKEACVLKKKNTKPHHRNNIKNLICLQYLFHSNNKNTKYSHKKKTSNFFRQELNKYIIY